MTWVMTSWEKTKKQITSKYKAKQSFIFDDLIDRKEKQSPLSFFRRNSPVWPERGEWSKNWDRFQKWCIKRGLEIKKRYLTF